MIKHISSWKLAVLILCFISIIIFSCKLVSTMNESSAEELGLSISKKYINIPALTQETHFYYIGEGQHEAIFIKLKFLKSDINQFLSGTCFGDLGKLSNTNLPFKQDSLPDDGLSIWWHPVEDKLSVGSICSTEKASFSIGIFQGNINVVVYLYIGIP